MKEFSLITGKDPAQFQSQWLSIEDKVLRYAEIEEKRKIKALMKEYKSSKHENTPGKALNVLALLSTHDTSRLENYLCTFDTVYLVFSARASYGYLFSSF